MPRSFFIGPLEIYFYGIIIMVGVIVAAWMSSQRARKYGQDPERVWDMLTWVLIGGIVGARLWHILTPPASMVEQGFTTGYYLTHPLEMLAIRRGGLGIPGAVIGGGLVMFWYTRRFNLNFLTWVDIAAPGLAVAQAIGRWGNYVNQEVYGSPSTLPWAILIDPENRLPGFQDQAYYHPLFLYESFWNLANAAFLIWVGQRFSHRLKPGDIFLIYLIIYPVGRFLLEFLRLDYSPVAGVNFNQAIMAVIALVSVLVFIRRRRSSVEAPREMQEG